MSFDDLPDNWSDLPLDTPGLAADVADLVVGHGDRLGGCVGLVLTTRERTMGQPCVVHDVDDTVDPEEFRPFLVQLAGKMAEDAGGLIFVRGRDGSLLLTEADRQWHRVAAEACREGGVTLLGSFLATPAAVRAFPQHLPTASPSAQAG